MVSACSAAPKCSTRLSRADTIVGRDAPVTAEAKGMTVFAENIGRVGVGEIPLNLVA